MGIRGWLKKLRNEEDAEAIARAGEAMHAKEGERWLAEEDQRQQGLDRGLQSGAWDPNNLKP